MSMNHKPHIIFFIIFAMISCKQKANQNKAISHNLHENPKQEEQFDYEKSQIFFITEAEVHQDIRLGLTDNSNSQDTALIFAIIIPSVIGVAVGAAATKALIGPSIGKYSDIDFKNKFKGLEQDYNRKIASAEAENIRLKEAYEAKIAEANDTLQVHKLEEQRLTQIIQTKELEITKIEAGHLNTTQGLQQNLEKLETDLLEKSQELSRLEASQSSGFTNLIYQYRRNEISRDQLNAQLSDPEKVIFEEIEVSQITKRQLEADQLRHKAEIDRLNLEKTAQISKLSSDLETLKKAKETGEAELTDTRLEKELIQTELDVANLELSRLRDQIANDTNPDVISSLQIIIKDLEEIIDFAQDKIKLLEQKELDELGVYTLSSKITAVPFKSVEDIDFLDPALRSQDEAYIVFNSARSKQITQELKRRYKIVRDPKPRPEGLPSGASVVKITRRDAPHIKAAKLLKAQLKDLSRPTETQVGSLADGSTYKLEPRIKAGSFGSIRLVHVFKDNGDHSLFAMKTFANEPDFRKALAKLNNTKGKLGEHKNLLKSYETIDDNTGRHAILYEYGGKDLESIKFAAHELKDAYRDILDGVEYIHSKGYIHWDLKRANTTRSKDGRIKIIDLDGITKRPPDEQGVRDPFIYTGIYSGPEVYTVGKPKIPFDKRKSDSYSVGTMMLEMRYNRSFSEIYEQVMKPHLENTYRQYVPNGIFLSRLKKHPAFNTAPEMPLIYKMLNPDPKKRPLPEEAKKELAALIF